MDHHLGIKDLDGEKQKMEALQHLTQEKTENCPLDSIFYQRAIKVAKDDPSKSVKEGYRNTRGNAF